MSGSSLQPIALTASPSPSQSAGHTQRRVSYNPTDKSLPFVINSSCPPNKKRKTGETTNISINSFCDGDGNSNSNSNSNHNNNNNHNHNQKTDLSKNAETSKSDDDYLVCYTYIHSDYII